MIICAKPDFLHQIQVPASLIVSSLDDLIEQLQASLQTRSVLRTVVLDLELLSFDDFLVPTLAKIHALSQLPLILVGSPERIAALPNTLYPHVRAVLNYPLTQLQWDLLQDQLNRQREIRAQIEASEQRISQLMEENRSLRLRLQNESLRDARTGLYHRQALLERLDEEWRRAHRHGHPLSALAIRLEDLPLEQPQTRELIRELAHRLHAVRASDISARLEDNLFVILLPLTEAEGVEALKAHFIPMIERLLRKHELMQVKAELLTRSETPRRHVESAQFLKLLLESNASDILDFEQELILGL